MLCCHNVIQKLLKISIAYIVLEFCIYKFQVEICLVHCLPEEEFLSNSGNKPAEKNNC